LSFKLLAIEESGGQGVVHHDGKFYMVSIDNGWKPIELQNGSDALRWAINIPVRFIEQEYESMKEAISNIRLMCLSQLKSPATSLSNVRNLKLLKSNAIHIHDKAAEIQTREKLFDLDEVILKYRSVISFRVKKSLGASTPELEDVVNEIITNVIEKLKKGEFRDESSIGTFIYTITSRRIIDYIRHKSKVLKHAPEPAHYPDLQEDIENKERAELMANAIEKLKPKYREVLYLYYYNDLSYKEIANIYGTNPNKVKTSLNDGVKLLKKLIKKRFSPT